MPYVQLRDFTCHYVERGGGPEPLVLVHGFLSSHRWWLPTLERLPARFRAYAVDLRGAGGSQHVGTGYTPAQHAEDLDQFADALGLDRFNLVGHSLGGGVALQYALQYPGRLTTLVLVDPIPPFGRRLPPEIQTWVNAQQGKPEGIRFLVEEAFERYPNAAYLEQLIRDGVGWDTATFFSSILAMARFNVSDRLTEVQTPTLVTWGDRDRVVPFAGIAELFSKISGCSLEVWHGVGHSGPIEVPDRFVELLSQFATEAGKRL